MPPKNDEAKGWREKLGGVGMTVVGAVMIASVFWTGGFVKQVTMEAADTHFIAVMTAKLPDVGDVRYVTKSQYLADQSQLVTQANEAELRRIEQEIARIEGQVQYTPDMSEGLRAQLELQLHTLKSQQAELLRKMGKDTG